MASNRFPKVSKTCQSILISYVPYRFSSHFFTSFNPSTLTAGRVSASFQIEIYYINNCIRNAQADISTDSRAHPSRLDARRHFRLYRRQRPARPAWRRKGGA